MAKVSTLKDRYRHPREPGPPPQTAAIAPGLATTSRPAGGSLASLSAIGVIVLMLAWATVTGQGDVIFPEGAALTFGIAVVGNPDWSVSRWRIVGRVDPWQFTAAIAIGAAALYINAGCIAFARRFAAVAREARASRSELVPPSSGLVHEET